MVDILTADPSSPRFEMPKLGDEALPSWPAANDDRATLPQSVPRRLSTTTQGGIEPQQKLGISAGAEPRAATRATDGVDRNTMASTAMPVVARRRALDATRWSLVLRAGGAVTPASRAALDELCRIYRAPLLAIAGRFERDPGRAEDLIQGFFARVVEKNVVAAADRERGRFRSFLYRALWNYALNIRDRRKQSFVDADLDNFASGAPVADRLYDKLWARTLLDRAHERLRDEQVASGKGHIFDALRDRLEGGNDGPTLRDVAQRVGKSEVAVKVTLFKLRRRYAELVREEVGETVAHHDDIDGEVRHFLDILRDDDE